MHYINNVINSKNYGVSPNARQPNPEQLGCQGWGRILYSLGLNLQRGFSGRFGIIIDQKSIIRYDTKVAKELMKDGIRVTRNLNSI